MAIVLVITGLILGTVIGAMNVQVTGQRIKETQERQRVIKEALINYIRQNSRLPCPADITAGVTGTNAGEVPADCAASTIAVDSGAARKGTIPWKTLGLNAESAQDAYGRLFTYIVTDEATTRDRNTISGLRGNLLIYPTATDVTANTNRLNPCNGALTICDNLAVVAIISHGANGFGAYSGQGSVISDAGASDDEKANTDHADLKLVDSDFNQQSFDDYVLWLKPSELLQPLTNSGALLDARAFNNIQFERLLAALATTTTIDASGVCYTLSTTLPTLKDAWGNDIVPGVSASQPICGADGTDVPMKSNGMDTSDTNDDQQISPALKVNDLFEYLQHMIGGP